MELQISCGVCPEISKESILRRETYRDKRNIKDAMSMEMSRNNRRRSMFRPHTFTFEYTAKNEYIRIYGIFERKY